MGDWHAREVPCPICHARVGQQCRAPISQRLIDSPHTARLMDARAVKERAV